MGTVWSIFTGALRRLKTGRVDVLGMCIGQGEAVLGNFDGEILRVYPVAGNVVWVKVPVLLPAKLVQEHLNRWIISCL